MLYTFSSGQSPAGAKPKQSRVLSAALALAMIAPFAASPADARSDRKVAQKTRAAVEQPKALEAEGPVLMLISLNQQRMFVYDSNGLVTQTRVSTGMSGFDTPKGIYAILEKKEDHASNIYEGAPMPFMQRLLMSGIAMHGGVVPNYPASHGCIRLPHDFARRFFNITTINERVVVMPDVQAPVGFEHPFLFSALPSMRTAESAGDKAVQIGVDVAETLLGVSSAQAATGPADRTVESASQDRITKRADLVAGIGAAGQRRISAAEGEKAANQAVSDARAAVKPARSKANDLDRVADKAADKLKSSDRALKSLQAQIAGNTSRIRSDKLEAMRADAALEAERIAPLTDEAQRAADAAKQAANEVKAAEQAVVAAQANLKAAKTEIKTSASAEVAAKAAVETFDRVEANRALPVSVLISSKTGMISVRQGFDRVLEVQASIDNPEVPLENFIFSAVGWKDSSKTALKWTATGVSEYSTSIASFDDDEDSRSKSKGKTRKEAKLPSPTDVASATATLDRIKIPQEASDELAELIKPGSTLIVSSYDMARSETRRGTDFVVQMPEVIAKITKPKPKIKPEDLDDDDDDNGGFFFFGSPPSSNAKVANSKKNRQTRSGSSKSTFW